VLVAVPGQRCSARACLFLALLRASRARCCCLRGLLAPTDQDSDPNGKWEGPGQAREGRFSSAGHVCLALGSSERDTAEGKDHLPAPAAHALPSAAQDTLSLLCPKGTLAVPDRSVWGPPILFLVHKLVCSFVSLSEPFPERGAALQAL